MPSAKKPRNARLDTSLDNARRAKTTHKNASQAQRERQLAEIAKRYLRGVTQHEIAVALGISQAQVAYDLKILSKRWRESGLRDFDDAKAQELAKIDALEREYWDAWQASKGTKQKKRTRGDGQGQLQNVAIESYDEAGDPRYLQGVQWCIEQRCKILEIGIKVKNEQSGEIRLRVVYDNEDAPDAGNDGAPAQSGAPSEAA